MRYGYVTVSALRHVTDASISAKSMCVENRIDASGRSAFLYIFTSNTKKSFSSHARSMAGNGEGDIYEKLVTEVQSHRPLYDPGRSSKDYHDSALKDNLYQSIATRLDIEGKYGIKNVWLVFRAVNVIWINREPGSPFHRHYWSHPWLKSHCLETEKSCETDAANGSSVDKDAFLTYFTACGKIVECP